MAIEKISINPFNLSTTIKGFVLKEPDGSQAFVSFDELYANVQGFSSLFRRAVILKEIRLTRPYVHVYRHNDGTYNFSDLIPKKEAEPKDATKSLLLSLNNIRIISGSINFDDGPMRTHHTVRDINLAIPFISNIGQDIDHYLTPTFSARINGNLYELKGKTKPFAASKETSFDLDVRDIDLPFYLNYLPVKLNCKLASARLDTKLNINFIMPEGKSPSVKVTGNFALNKIVLDDLL